MPTRKKNFVNQISEPNKAVIGLVIGVIVYFLFPLQTLQRVLLAWDAFCFTMLVLCWITFFTTDAADIRTEAQKQDGSRIVIFIITLLATTLSMFSVIEMIISGSQDDKKKAITLFFGMACMILSWCLVHTIFTAKYAHMYYGKNEEFGGLDFPGKTKPDFVDFAYFAFTIGMTFQVSDVEISNRQLRRLALLHGLFSFAFNALVIALSVNIISGLVSK